MCKIETRPQAVLSKALLAVVCRLLHQIRNDYLSCSLRILIIFHVFSLHKFFEKSLEPSTIQKEEDMSSGQNFRLKISPHPFGEDTKKIVFGVFSFSEDIWSSGLTAQTPPHPIGEDMSSSF